MLGGPIGWALVTHAEGCIMYSQRENVISSYP